MKKILIAAIVAAGCVIFANAASIDWQFSQQIRTDKGTSSDLTGYSAYLFTASAWSTVEAAVSGGALDATKFTGYLDDAALQVTTAATAKTYITGSQTTTSTSLSDGTYYIVLANLDAGGDIWSKSFAMSTYDESADPVPAHENYAWTISKMATGSYLNNGNSAGWTVSVPEPTTGLMLLLGMAGLALKRKRA